MGVHLVHQVYSLASLALNSLVLELPIHLFQSIFSKDEGCSDGNGAVCVHTTNIKILHFALLPQHWIVFPCSLPGCNEGQEEQHKPLLCALQRCKSAKVVWVLLGPLCWHGKVSLFPRRKSVN